MAYRNNNLQNAGEDMPAEELKNIVSYALGIFDSKKPDLHNPKEVEAAIRGYFQNCIDKGIRPGNLGLYAALGLSKQDVHDAINGRNKSKVSRDCIDLLKNAKQAMSAYREGLATSGRLNPATYIFMGKNFDNLEDVTRLDVSRDRDADGLQLSQEELQRRIPIYSDAEQQEE